jgi:trehalose synthase
VGTLPRVSGGLQPVDLAPRPLGDLAPACGVEALERIRAAAVPVTGTRVLHLTVAGAGGRVPELLQGMLPLALDAGLAVDWRVMFGGPELTVVAAALQDGIQGAETAIDDEAMAAYVQACASAVAEAGEEYDAVVVHEPAAAGAVPAAGGTVLWNCHLDASAPDAPAWERLEPLVAKATVVVPAAGLAPPGTGQAHELPPGIDPLSPRNLELAPRLAGRLLRQLGVDLNRPFACQLMRMDRWKDPHSTLEAFALAREELPFLQLVLALEVEREDWPAVKEISDYAGEAEGVFVLTSYSGLGSLELGALERIARVCLMRALREGFGLAASEALWKATPVIAGPDGGIPLQVREGVDGYLTGTPGETAARLVELVGDPGLAIEMGKAGREHVRERFLVTRMLEGHLRLLADTLGRS